MAFGVLVKLGKEPVQRAHQTVGVQKGGEFGEAFDVGVQHAHVVEAMNVLFRGLVHRLGSVVVFRCGGVVYHLEGDKARNRRQNQPVLALVLAFVLQAVAKQTTEHIFVNKILFKVGERINQITKIIQFLCVCKVNLVYCVILSFCLVYLVIMK